MKQVVEDNCFPDAHQERSKLVTCCYMFADCLIFVPELSMVTFLRYRMEFLLTRTVRLMAIEAHIMWQQCQILDSSVLRNLTSTGDCSVN